ncbi:MAG: GNAT family N-acetyltransferase [Chloroherpetonaceae bacterium]|nr:GNAT family N-acetyltransferase [Chloroherpetonaceae bacterium]
MIRVVPYSPEYYELWENFVAESNNGTLFHRLKFLDYHPENRFAFHHLLFFQREKLVAVLPAALTEENTCLESPIGASYGGLVVKDMKYHEHEPIVDALTNYAVSSGLTKIRLTTAPFIYQKKLTQNLDYALAYKGYHFERHYISHAIPLEQTSDFTAHFSPTARRYIHQCERNQDLIVELAQNQKGFEEFYPILLENKARHNAKPTHTFEEILRLKEFFPNSIHLFLVRYKGKAIGGSLLFDSNEQVTLCFYNMLLYEFNYLHPIHYVMDKVTKWAIQRKFRYVDIGVSQNTAAENQMTPAYSLIEFKEKFCSTGILRSTFIKHFNNTDRSNKLW